MPERLQPLILYCDVGKVQATVMVKAGADLGDNVNSIVKIPCPGCKHWFVEQVPRTEVEIRAETHGRANRLEQLLVDRALSRGGEHKLVVARCTPTDPGLGQVTLEGLASLEEEEPIRPEIKPEEATDEQKQVVFLYPCRGWAYKGVEPGHVYEVYVGGGRSGGPNDLLTRMGSSNYDPFFELMGMVTESRGTRAGFLPLDEAMDLFPNARPTINTSLCLSCADIIGTG